MLFTHLGNKCFRTRDVSFRKGFKDRIGMLPEEKPEGTVLWKRIRTVPGYEYNLVETYDSLLAITALKQATASSGAPSSIP
jgi:hypothetical protein